MKMADVEASKSKDSHEEEERKTIISRVMNMDVKVDKGGTRATVVLPGLSYDDFDRTDQVGVWKIAAILSKGRVQMWIFGHEFSRNMFEIMASQAPFTLGSQVHIRPNFYRSAKRQQLNFPIKATTELVGVGNSSTALEDILHDPQTGEVLATEINVFVTVDMETRKPAPLPREKQVNLDPLVLQYKIPRFPRLTLPQSQTYTKLIIPGYTDTDMNLHTNRAVYIRFVMDSAACASASGFYTYFKKDIASYQVKILTITYRGESYPGDRLLMHCWEDGSDCCKLYFKLIKEDNGRAIMDCIVEYYKDLQGHL